MCKLLINSERVINALTTITFYLTLIHVFAEEDSTSSVDLLQAVKQHSILQNAEQNLTAYIYKVLDHYKQVDPIGIPGVPIPDPLGIPPLSHPLSIGKMNFRDVQLYGLSKFRLDEVKVDVANMKVEAALSIDTLDVHGNYTLSTWFSRAQGPFTVKLSDVHVKAVATLEVERTGQLEAQDINMDITFKHIEMNFEGLGFFANMFQGVINSVGTFIFDSIKPFILSEVNTNLRKDVNEQVRKINQTFPNSISPFDHLIAEVRHRIRVAHFDPYRIHDYNHSVGFFDVYLRYTQLTGLASVHRVGDIQFEIINNTVHAVLDVGTQKLDGTSFWELVFITGLVSKVGTVDFSVDYINVRVALNQTMDTRNHPILDDIQLELGNIQVRFDGAGTLDYLVELGINVLPNLLRYQIMDAIEYPIKQRVKEILTNVNVEQLIKENVKNVEYFDGFPFRSNVIE